MKFAAGTDALATALSQVELALDARIVVAILGGVHIKAGADGGVRLVVNALDRVITVTVTAEVKEPGETVVRASALAELVRGFAKDGTVEIGTDAHGAWIRCGRARYQLAVLPVEQLPAVPTIHDVTGEAELDRKGLLEAIKRVVFAASTEESRYYLNGILLIDEDDRLALVATDGHRLARRQIPSAPFSQSHACILPNTSTAAIVRLLTKTAAENVRLRRSKTLLEVSALGFTLVTKLVAGTYPAYQRVIPAAPANSVTVERADLVAALARLAAVVEHSKLAVLVGLAWNPDEPVLRLSLPHQPGVADDVIPATVVGGAAVETAAQIHHVVELVDEIRGKSIRVATDGLGHAILVTDPDSDAVLVVQMPCRVSTVQSPQAA